jgi:hypothetical protein
LAVLLCAATALTLQAQSGDVETGEVTGFGGGLLLDSFRAAAGAAPQVPPPSGGLVLAIDDFKFGFQPVGGFRYYVGKEWGIRPE